ncbi:MAG: acyltransferase [Candidatus Eisenbacteria bacterium]|uniref:Acyltransferase n=1 Tax=Eiseniibacteriota bacterium TaxID=2212470 RepID=A0A948RX72_UNCEI|nr:acyltransferase [Candidatus Eisenbacteria bacterium]MBU1948494.1 acyltransferase [Candidatus Eisenbacteria bacterium]MBU2689884.1 acyltransferase [Candidatus Eisenbacteria bacterium]
MKAACLQLHPVFGDPSGNMDRAEPYLRDAAQQGVQLIVLPELYPTGYTMTSRAEAYDLAETIPGGPSVRRLEQWARETGSFYVMGMAERAGDKVYNASVLVGPAGHISTYRKIHLFYKENEWFDPGEEPPHVVEIACGAERISIGMMICFDWIFPEMARSLALLGAQVVCHPSNLVLHFCQDAMVTRSIENQVFTMTCNRIGTESRAGLDLTFTGGSQITSPDGKVLGRCLPDVEGLISAEFDPARALNKNVTDYNHILNQRRSDLYRL